MSKTIKLEDPVYYELDDLRGKRDTFNDVVKRLLAIVKPLREASDILGPHHYLKQRPQEESGVEQLV